jgi:hypothetical protein
LGKNLSLQFVDVLLIKIFLLTACGRVQFCRTFVVAPARKLFTHVPTAISSSEAIEGKFLSIFNLRTKSLFLKAVFSIQSLFVQ